MRMAATATTAIQKAGCRNTTEETSTGALGEVAVELFLGLDAGHGFDEAGAAEFDVHELGVVVVVFDDEDAEATGLVRDIRRHRESFMPEVC